MTAYRLLPFRFLRFDDTRTLVVNDTGEFHFLANDDFTRFVDHELSADSSTYLDLKAKHFLFDSASRAPFELLATKYRTKKAFLDGFTSLQMEMFGLVHKHLDELWIDPANYQRELIAAGGILCDAGMNVSIYNHQLCVLDPQLWPLARKSISDWKNVYLPQCDGCSAIGECGGFFQSGTKVRSAAIRPL